MRKFQAKAKNFLASKFVKSSLFLFACVLVCKILGLVYRIPLTNIVGLEGVGIYQLVFPLYSFLLILSSNAVPLALSKIISSKLHKGEFNYASKLKKISLIFFSALGLIFSLLLFAFAQQISSAQGNNNAFLGYLMISPSILLVSIIAVIRGFFQAEKNIVPTGISQIIEQVIKFGFGIFLPMFYSRYGLNFQVATSLFAVTISELFALIYLCLAYFLKGKKQKFLPKKIDNSFASTKTIFVDLIKTIFPIMLANLILPFCVLAESFLIVNFLKNANNELWQATAIYGAYSGIVCTLINAPVTLISSIGSVLVPYASEETTSTSNGKELKTSLKLTALISIPSALILALFSFLIVSFLFPSIDSDLTSLTALMLALSSINVVSLSFSHVISVYLQSKNQMYAPVKCLLIFNAIRIVLGVLALTKFGILGFVVSSAFAYCCQALQFSLILKSKKAKQYLENYA